jgi:hypothetical protein
MNIICLIFAFVFFAIGAFPEWAGSKITWQNAGFAAITLALIIG